MIPHVFHRVWIGDRPMPPEFVEYGKSWLHHHPGWVMQEWTDTTLTTRYPDIVRVCREHRHRSNIHRYELLHRFGGVYIDTDFECRRSIEPLLEGTDFVTAAQSDDLMSPGALNPAFFGSVAASPITRLLVDGIPSAYAIGSMLTDAFARSHFGPLYFTDVVRGLAGVRVLPRAQFYPYPYDDLDRVGEVFPDAYAVHHWAARRGPFAGRMIGSWR
jgi:mannosyltransferase OCH1-like enzyme